MTTERARYVLVDWVTLHAWDAHDQFPRLVDNLLLELSKFGLEIVPVRATSAMEEAGRREIGMYEPEGTASGVWDAMIKASRE